MGFILAVFWVRNALYLEPLASLVRGVCSWLYERLLVVIVFV